MGKHSGAYFKHLALPVSKFNKTSPHWQNGGVMNQVIITAIHQKKLLSLSYGGIKRTVEPHSYGVSGKGDELLRCYQVRGDHTSYTSHDWDLLTVSKMTAITMTETEFPGARRDYKKDDKAMQRIYAQL
jgi:hypothetical protein